jgi:hypothetical protein
MGSEAKYWATAVLVLNTCDSFAKTSLSIYIHIFFPLLVSFSRVELWRNLYIDQITIPKTTKQTNLFFWFLFFGN